MQLGVCRRAEVQPVIVVVVDLQAHPQPGAGSGQHRGQGRARPYFAGSAAIFSRASATARRFRALSSPAGGLGPMRCSASSRSRRSAIP